MNDEIQKIKAIFNDNIFSNVILFGSRARGDFSKKSDYDILLITKKIIPIKEKMKLAHIFRQKLAKIGIDSDIIIKSKEEVEYYKNKIGNVVRSALKEGIDI